MSRPNVYLCGPITGCTLEEAKNGWRKEVFTALDNLGIDALSPVRHLEAEHLGDQGTGAISAHGADAGALSTPRGLTQRDRWDTKRSDLIFCNLLDTPKISVGSMIEFGWADAWGIPILLVMDENNIHNHAMVNAIASWVVPTLNDGIVTTFDLLLPGV